jgi:hypothetical protein
MATREIISEAVKKTFGSIQIDLTKVRPRKIRLKGNLVPGSDRCEIYPHIDQRLKLEDCFLLEEVTYYPASSGNMTMRKILLDGYFSISINNMVCFAGVSLYLLRRGGYKLVPNVLLVGSQNNKLAMTYRKQITQGIADCSNVMLVLTGALIPRQAIQEWL